MFFVFDISRDDFGVFFLKHPVDIKRLAYLRVIG